MPIINKGIFNINSAYLRDVGNDWPTAQVTTTSDVIESASNLYFTNTRVVSALIAGDNISIESNGRISANITSAINDIANISLTIDNLTTDGITEGTVNLYYTNTRVVSALIAGENITIESNGRISANVQQTTAVSLNLTTADVRETSNLYFTNTRVVSAVVPLLTTANVIETSSNLYFTNTRSREAISGSTGVIYDSSTGAISIGQNVATTASVTFKDVFVSNNLVVYGSTTTWGANNLVVSDNMIYLNNNSNTSNPDLGISFNYYDGVYHHAGFFRDASDGIFKVFDNYEPEPDANIFIDTDHNTFRLANLQATNYIGNVTGFVTGQVSSLGNHTTSNLTEGTNQYFTNARVVSALIAGDNISIESNGRISANVNVAQLNLNTDVVAEGANNLYYTNSRVISALTAGKGITIGLTGTISSYNETPFFNTLVNGAAGGNVLSTMSPIVSFPSSPVDDRFLVHSIHLVNLSGTTSLISGNVLYATGNTAVFANQIPVPVGGVLEFMKSPQLFQAGDKINLQGFDSTGVATSNLMTYIINYQNFSDDISYIGLGQTLATSNTSIMIYDSVQGYSILESIKFVNLQNTSVPITAYWGDANGIPKAYFAYNLQIPSNSSVELLQKPKKLELYDRIYANYSNAPNAAVSVFTSAKLSTYYAFSSYSSNLIVYGQSLSTTFSTSEPDGTILYYTVE